MLAWIGAIVVLCQEDLDKLRGCEGLMRRAEESLDRAALPEAEAFQSEVVRRLGELLRQGRASSRTGEARPAPRRAAAPAPRAYVPERTAPPGGAFVSRGAGSAWGNLPDRIRQAILRGSRDVDQYPAEFRELIREYMKTLSGK